MLNNIEKYIEKANMLEIEYIAGLIIKRQQQIINKRNFKLELLRNKINLNHERQTKFF